MNIEELTWCRRLEKNDPELLDVIFDGTGDNGMRLIANSLVHNTVLRSLELRNLQELSPLGASFLAQAVHGLPSLENLVVQNGLSQGVIPELLLRALLLQHQHRQQEEENLQEERLSVLQVLFLSEDLLTESSLSFLEQLLVKNRIERELVLIHVGMTDAHIASLSSQALSTSKLVSLELSDNEIGDDGVIALSKALRGNRSLMHLNLSGNRIGNRGVTALAQAILQERGSSESSSSSSELRTLNLSRNPGITSTKVLGHALSNKCSLKGLYLSKIPWTNPSFLEPLAVGLRRNTELRVLVYSRDHFCSYNTSPPPTICPHSCSQQVQDDLYGAGGGRAGASAQQKKQVVLHRDIQYYLSESHKRILTAYQRLDLPLWPRVLERAISSGGGAEAIYFYLRHHPDVLFSQPRTTRMCHSL